MPLLSYQVAKGTRVTAMCMCEEAAQIILATEKTGSVTKLTSMVSGHSGANSMQAEVVGLRVEEEGGLQVLQRVWVCDTIRRPVSAMVPCGAPGIGEDDARDVVAVAVADTAGTVSYLVPAPVAHPPVIIISYVNNNFLCK
jgi:hypothetical protein